ADRCFPGVAIFLWRRGKKFRPVTYHGSAGGKLSATQPEPRRNPARDPRRRGTRGRFPLTSHQKPEESMRRSFLAAAIVPAVAFAAVTLGQTREAAAGPTVDLNLNLGTAFQAGPNTTAVDFSAGGGVAVGYRFYLPGTYLYLQPEVGGNYMRFGFN